MKNFLNCIFIISALFIQSYSYTPEGDEYLLPRQNGMANTGYSLSEDENVLYYNPAGLGLLPTKPQYFSMLYGGITANSDDGEFSPLHKRFAALFKTKNKDQRTKGKD